MTNKGKSPDAGSFRVAGHEVSRRDFLRWAAAGGAAALVAGCALPGTGPGAGGAGGTGGATAYKFVKDPSKFIPLGTNLETRLELLDGILTPKELFFVRNNDPTGTPRIDAKDFRLVVEGDAVERTVSLTYEDILALPSRSLIAFLECAGNWRGFFEKVVGKPAQGTQWGAGAIGCAVWTGPSLSAVLDRAGVKKEAVDVHLIGLDRKAAEGGFNRPIPVEKALDSDTILAYAMNGEDLPPDHGFPLRAIVPGWVGANCIKWLGRIVVSSKKVWCKNNRDSYILEGPDWPADKYRPAKGGPITKTSIKSALALPWPAALRPGRRALRGFAQSPDARISKVEWSGDGGKSWTAARLQGPVLKYAWTRFDFEWEAGPGSHSIRTRATDEAGNTQPDSAPFNAHGYLLNIPLPHPITVA